MQLQGEPWLPVHGRMLRKLRANEVPCCGLPLCINRPRSAPEEYFAKPGRTIVIVIDKDRHPRVVSDSRSSHGSLANIDLDDLRAVECRTDRNHLWLTTWADGRDAAHARGSNVCTNGGW
jgi:hypothetical protein